MIANTAPTPRALGALKEIAAAAVPALITAAAHLLVVAIRRELFPTSHWDWNTRDVVWLVPAGYLLIFALLSLPLAVLALIRRRGVPGRLRVWYWTSFSVFSVLLLFTRVHSVAWLMLALGAGFQVSLLARKYPALWTRLVRTLGGAVALALLVLATTHGVRRVSKERGLLARLPAARADAPNILLIIWDTARAQSMSLYGYGRKTTPFLDSLAQHAVVYDYAYSTAPWTLPSHASILTGQYAGNLTADWTSPLDQTHRTLPEALYEDGYSTGAFIANFFAASYPTGLHRGFIRYEAVKRTLEEVALSTTLSQARSIQNPLQRLLVQRWPSQAVKDFLRLDFRPLDLYQLHDKKEARTVTEDFLRWQASVRRPFFSMLNYMEAHAGYATPMDTLFEGGRIRKDEYDGSISYLDQELQRLMEALQERGELERTIVILTSDHGELFGEHGRHGHGAALYSPVLRVPLVIFAPGRLPEGVRVARAVSLRDMARTVQVLAGSRSTPFPGASLARLALDSTAAVSPAIAEVSKGINQPMDEPISWGSLTAAFDDTLHVIQDGRGNLEAYAYRRDPLEQHDLARDPARRDALARWLATIVQGVGLNF
jgi:arylsulfatase A-like enzyme